MIRIAKSLKEIYPNVGGAPRTSSPAWSVFLKFVPLITCMTGRKILRFYGIEHRSIFITLKNP